MSIYKKILVLSLIGLITNGYLYADDKQSSPVFTIYGNVTDKTTSAPIVNAEVVAKTEGDTQTVFTNDFGRYIIHIRSAAWLKTCEMKVTAKEYQKEKRTVFLPPWSNEINVDFKLIDITIPHLKIHSPSEGEEIFTNPTIRLRYRDRGSGIDKTTVKIFANDRDLSGYIEEITDQKAVCVIPDGAPLEVGLCVISAEVKDLTGNLAHKEISVTVVSELGSLLNLGKQALVEGDVLTAHQYFTQALAMGPDNREANFYYAITRLATLPQRNNNIFYLFQNMGFTGINGASLTPEDLNLFKFSAQAPEGFESFNLVDTFPNGQTFQDSIKYEIIPELDGSLGNLALALENKDFVSHFKIDNPFTGTEKIEIDYGDAAMLKSIIYLIKAKMLEALVYNIDSQLAELSDLFSQGILNLRYVLGEYPELLRVKDIPQSIASRDAFVSAIESYIEGFNFIHAETDDQFDDLLSISHVPEYEEQAVLFNAQINDIKKSLLSQPDSEFRMGFSQLLDAGYLFFDPFDFRRMLDADGVSHLLSNYFIPEIDYTLTNLSKANNSYQEFLPPDNPFYSGEKKDVDFADISAMKMGLESMRIAILSALGYDLNLNGQEILLRFLEKNPLNINDIVAYHPAFLHLVDTANIDLARDAFNNIINRYMDTTDYFKNETDGQSDDLLILSSYFLENESRYRAMLNQLNTLQNTLIDPQAEVFGDEFHLNLGEFFVNYKDIREFLPQFDEENHIIPGTWPDPTFGGILPDNEFKK